MKKLAATLAFLLLAAPVAAQRMTLGAFRFVQESDPITDKNASYAYTDGLVDSDTALHLWCQEGELTVAFDPSTYLGPSSYDMYWRFDKTPSVGPFKFDESKKGTWAYIPTNMVSRFLTSAKSAKQVTLRANDQKGVPYTDTFDLRGIGDVLKRLKC
ncbi:hypothetical protein [Deinococcus yavapaiensis]|uniref:Uncharacterized protein n=1 Tax=Deinococcus yavapaiensis KR-236 TaxID=694435 RepID=A0A318SAL7_9DEIO|nr:hypothetical protein [Deinococcus yavapaiensis]PYE53291.1 hypothetical protein DES52_10963 [Deinococcus yavapaiensis KR-236]